METSSALQTITVALGNNPYDILIGHGWLQQLGHKTQLPSSVRTLAVFVSSEVWKHHRDYVQSAVNSIAQQHNVAIYLQPIDDGEATKNVNNLTAIWQHLAEHNIRRTDAILAIGGGVIGDMVGFAAATWNRGIPVIHVPTTLLAMVDSSIGGKTGINLAAGKNLVGAFHQPLHVAIDTHFLTTLQPRELRAGLGEVAKYAYIADPSIAQLLTQNASELQEPLTSAAADSHIMQVITTLVQKSVAIKAEVVADDEREQGRRAHLNYGHTFGHAIEKVTNYQVFRHGEAVGLGMIVASRMAASLGLSDLTDHTIQLLDSIGLPVRWPEAKGLTEDLLQAMYSDKKTTKDGIRVVLATDIGHVRVMQAPKAGEIESAWNIMFRDE